MQPIVQSISILTGREIIRWVGTEMAVDEEPVQWEHPAVPYLQCIAMDIWLACGARLRMISHLEDGTGFHGFFLFDRFEGPALDPLEPYEVGSIYRTRELDELPVGVARVALVRKDGPNAEIEAHIEISGSVVRALAGEVYAESNSEAKIVTPDESILLQVNGLRPGRG